MTKSMMVVVPPAMPAAVPVKKSSMVVVPMNGSCMWVCGSMPPGMTYWPTAHHRGRRGAQVLAHGHEPAVLGEHVGRKARSALTTVPPRMNRFVMIAPKGSYITRFYGG